MSSRLHDILYATRCIVCHSPLRFKGFIYVEIAALICRSTCKDIFVCDEESHFYSQCLVKLVLKDCDKREEVHSDSTHIAGFGANSVHVITQANLVLWIAGCATHHVHNFRLSSPASCTLR